MQQKVASTEIDTDNKEFQDALHLTQYTRTSLFLTGKAGTGKSTFLRYICAHTKKKYVVLAPTGIAAINAGGTTLHSFFRLPFRPVLPDDPDYSLRENKIYRTLRYTAEHRELIRKIELVIIDEISMVRADLIDLIDRILRVYSRNLREPFGGKQILLVGDIFQLEPVVKSDEREILNRFYPSPFFFHARVFREFPLVSIELKKVYRQKDPVFVRLLDRIRSGEAGTAELQLLNLCHRDAASAEKDSEQVRITLASKRGTVDYINEHRLQQLPGECVVFRGTVSGEFPETALPTSMELTLKPGAQVIFVKNDTEKQFVNGTVGIITELGNDGLITVRTDEGRICSVRQAQWNNIRYCYNEEERRIDEEIIGSFEQYPLKLAWAITIHKSQGLTFNRVNVDLSGGVFAAGQTYVALSRCTSLEGLSLSTPVSPSDIFVSRDVRAFASQFNNPQAIRKALKGAKADMEYRAALDAFESDDFSSCLDHLFCAMHERYDLERPLIRRFLSHKLGIIRRLKAENSALRSKEAERKRQLRHLADEYCQMGNDCITLAKDVRAALANYNKALELDPSHTESWIRKGITLFDAPQQDAHEALKCLNQAVRLSPLNFKALYNRGRIRLHFSMFDEALSDLLRAAELKKTHAAVHDRLAEVYDAMGNEEQAELHRHIAEKLRKIKRKGAE